MIILRHVHLFLKAGLTVEHGGSAEMLLFDLLSVIVTLATFERWTGRYIRLRYFLRRCRWALRDYIAGWRGDMGLVWRAWAGCPAWTVGAG